MTVKITPRQLYENMRKETIPCGVCDSATSVPIFHCGDYSMDIQSAICKICGFVFTNPRPTKDEIDKFYKGNYRKTDLSPLKPVTPYNPASSIYKRAEWLFSVAKPYLEQNGAREPKVLDIGCGSGIILHIFKTLWPQSRLFGVEPSPTYGKYAQEMNSATIYNGELESFLAKNDGLKGTFDIIVLNHVFEHLYDPVEKLKSLRELLTDKGLLLVQVPNPFSTESAGILRMFHLAHVNQFSSNSLQIAFERAGFDILGEFPSKPRVITFLGQRSSVSPCPNSVKPLTGNEFQTLFDRIRKKASTEYFTKNPHQKERQFPWIYSLRNHFWHRFHYPKLRSLIRGKRVVIVGSGASSHEVLSFPDDVCFLACNGGYTPFLNGAGKKMIDLFLCEGLLLRKKPIKHDLSQIQAKLFLSDDPAFIKKKKAQSANLHLMLDPHFDDPFFEKLFRFGNIRQPEWDKISAEIRLIQIASYFQAKEIYIIGDDFLNNRYIWEDEDDEHEEPMLSPNEMLVQIVSQKNKNIYTISAQSELAKYFPLKKAGQ